MKRIFCVLLSVLTLCLCFTACSKNDADTTQPTSTEHSKVKFTMDNGGEFVIELYPEYAPKTVANFLKLVGEGFYDGLTFHRVIEGFMAQGGEHPQEATMDIMTIEGEFASNGFTQNTLKHERGVISMARTSEPNSASTQFFICYDTAAHLDGDYAAFGKVIEGMEVIDGFLKIERTMGFDGQLSSPVEPITIKTAVVL
ncbi:MAG: peptidylprolyl isomerase [Ruminococcaceae bacterium]|nr:peptidylprolyl isomerase [Oscillospiraceae bacterium]